MDFIGLQALGSLDGGWVGTSSRLAGSWGCLHQISRPRWDLEKNLTWASPPEREQELWATQDDNFLLQRGKGRC
jgi:hypothetical protein